MKRLIIGLAGDPGSGKTALAEYLAERHQFHCFEGSTVIRDFAKNEGMELRSRHDYSNFHARIQKRLGQDVLAQTLLARSEDRIVFAGLRSTHNARTIQQVGGLVIGLTCPLEVCFARAKKPGMTFDAFKQEAKSEWYSRDGYGADLKPVLGLADVTLDASQPLEGCYAFMDAVVAKISVDK